MDKPDVEIKISGGKFKILCALIIALGSVQTWFQLREQRVAFAEMRRVADSLHYVQMGVISQSTTWLELEQERRNDEVIDAIGRIIIPPITDLQTRVGRIEHSVHAIPKHHPDYDSTNTKLLWQLLELQQRPDTTTPPPPVLATPNPVDRSRPSRTRN